MNNSELTTAPVSPSEMQPLLDTIRSTVELLEKKLGADADLIRLRGATSDLAGIFAHPPVAAPDPVPKNPEPPANDRRRVLYIEDNPANFRLIVNTFEQLRPNLEPIAATTAREGIELGQTIRPDLILLDLNLPDMHGSEVLRRLHQNPLTSSIPVVVLSADATPSQIERLLLAGARHYLIKPFDLVHFVAVIDGIFEHEQTPVAS